MLPAVTSRVYRIAAILLIAMSASFVILPNSPAAAQPKLPRFETSKCKFRAPRGDTEGKSVICGYVIVPQDHTKPDGPTIRLAVTVFKSRNATPQPDAVIYLDGGPGGFTLQYADIYADLMNSLRLDRDLILFDQRGVGYSEPQLACPESIQLAYKGLEDRPSREKQAARELQALQQCWERLAKKGVDFTVFNSVQNAADVNAIREAFGYKQVNLYGISYGTRLGLTVMRDHATGVRSAILDSVVPLEADFSANYVRYTDRAFKAVFRACADDVTCSRSYPDLENVFYKLVDSLQADPATATGKHPITGKTYQVVIDGDRLIDYVFNAFYSTTEIPSVPRLIYAANNGQFEDLADKLVENAWEQELYAVGMYYAVDCNEEVSFSSYEKFQSAVKGYPPQLIDYFATGVKALFQICGIWQSGKAVPTEDQPVSSPIPTLVMAGAFDPITPPDYSKQVAKSLPKSFYYEVPNAGHGPSLDGACTFGVVRAFLAAPTVQPTNTKCITQLGGPDFEAGN